MGYLIKIECSFCGKQETFPLGYSRKDYELNVPMVLGFCEKCKIIRTMRIGDFCDCGKALDVIYNDLMREKGIKIIPCPICKSNMKLTTVGHWD